MKEKTRQYHCARCRKKITVCSLCDHGRIYCASCAVEAYKQAQCKASQRYQQTPKGKANHVKRQKHYREHQKNKIHCVTHPSGSDSRLLVSLLRHDYIGDHTIADALLDRVVHQA